MKVYCIENILTGKKYVGITTGEIQRRFKKHKELAKSNKNKQHLHKALLKYGFANFKIYELDTAQNKEELFLKEKEWIIKLDTKNNGYNETDGGEGSFGRILSEETKKKISMSNKHKILSEEHKFKIKQSLIGKNNKQNNPFYGKKHSIETIDKITSHKSICKFCGIQTTNANIKRWHNDRCKNKSI